ncbi:MAG: sodium-dependent bicarbonate transport family permease [Planctomycetes bacterium]|nr:sodium-dependent bicarbonate transport family permease [Planctomycetota bacterium]
MDALELVRLNLLSPMVLGFALGIVAALVKSDVKLPEALHSGLSAYLLLAIGLKGGIELGKAPLGELSGPLIATLAVGLTSPLWCFATLRGLGKLGVADAAAIAAHYGSVSVVTFTACGTFLDAAGVAYEGFMSALVAFLEVPAIIVAIFLARRTTAGTAHWGETLREVVFGKSNLLLLGGVAIGALSGPAAEQVKPFFVDPFRGALTLFLIDMGVLAARRLGDLRATGGFLVAFALLMPLVNGAIGALVGDLAGLSLGGTTVFATMVASASYIAAPVAVRIALPEANPALYLTSSLALTFPFNLTVGIPVYHAIARWLHA